MTDLKKLTNINKTIKSFKSQEEVLNHQKILIINEFNTRILNLLNKYFLKKASNLNSKFNNQTYYLSYKDCYLVSIKILFNSHKEIEDIIFYINYNHFYTLNPPSHILKEVSILLNIFENKKVLLLNNLIKINEGHKSKIEKHLSKRFSYSEKLTSLFQKQKIIFDKVFLKYITTTRMECYFKNNQYPTINIEDLTQPLSSISHIQYNNIEKSFEFISSKKDSSNNFIKYKIKSSNPKLTFLRIHFLRDIMPIPEIFFEYPQLNLVY
jgi:hypothetical protein